MAAALSGLFEISDRSELRLRDPGSLANSASVDLETAGKARLMLTSRRVLFNLSYAPRVTLWDLNDAPSLTLMQEVAARGEWHNRFGRVWLEQLASYGGINLTSLSFEPSTEGGPPHVDTVPVSRVINYASSMTTLGTRLALRRWSLEWTLGYQLAGGADADARTILPMQSGPFAAAVVDVIASRRAHFLTTLSGSEASFSSGPEDVLVEAVEGFRYAWSRSVTTELKGGIAEARTRPSDVSSSKYQTYPVAEAALEQLFSISRGGHWAMRLSAGVEPVVNRLFGTVDERLQGSVHLTWTHRSLKLDSFATAQQTVPTEDPNAVELVAGEMVASYPTSKTSFLAFDLGVRALAQRLNVPANPGVSDAAQVSFVEAIAFVGLSFRAHQTRW